MPLHQSVSPSLKVTLPRPAFTQCRALEQGKQVVGDDTDAEENGVRGKLPAGHALHAKACPELAEGPIFNSLMPFPDTSPRWRYQISISSVDSTLNGNTVCVKVLIVPSPFATR